MALAPVPIKRKEVKHFLNTGTSSTPVYSLIGDGVTSAKINMNPQTLEETYIHETTGHTQIESYRPTLPIEMTAKHGDAAFDFVENLRVNRAILSDAQTDLVNVWLYETPVAGAYPAEKQSVSIQVDDFGGEGGTVAKLNYTINYLGDPVKGTFNPTTLTFTANP
jgi:hypothetical protein